MHCVSKFACSEFGVRKVNSFLDLPSELRIMVIDEMQPDDRCRFTRCSKICRKEARSSKNYIHTIEFHYFTMNNIHISVFFKKSENNKEFGYRLEFQKKTNKKKQIKCTMNSEEAWKTKLKNSVDLAQLAIQHFKTLLKHYRNSIKRLDVNGQFRRDFNFGNFQLKNLEELRIIGNFPQLFLKAKNPLKEFTAAGTNHGEIANWEQIYEVQNVFKHDNLKLNKQQFLRLSASNIQLPIGYVTEEDIVDIIKSWAKKTIGREVVNFSWNLVPGSNFDSHELYRLLQEAQEGFFRLVRREELDNPAQPGAGQVNNPMSGVINLWGNQISFNTSRD